VHCLPQNTCKLKIYWKAIASDGTRGGVPLKSGNNLSCRTSNYRCHRDEAVHSRSDPASHLQTSPAVNITCMVRVHYFRYRSSVGFIELTRQSTGNIVKRNHLKIANLSTRFFLITFFGDRSSSSISTLVIDRCRPCS